MNSRDTSHCRINSTGAIDLAKNVFQLAVADSAWHVMETHRLTRAQFAHWFDNRSVGLVDRKSVV